MKRIITVALCLAGIACLNTFAQNTGKDRLKELEEKTDEIKEHKKAKTKNDLFELNAVSYVGFGWSRVDGDAFRNKFGKSKLFYVNLLEGCFNPAGWLSLSVGVDAEGDFFSLAKDNNFEIQADNTLNITAPVAGENWQSSVFSPFSFVVPAAISFHLGDVNVKLGAEALFNVKSWNDISNRYSIGKSQYEVYTKGGVMEKFYLRYQAVVDFDGLGVFYKYCPESIIPGSDMIKGYQTLGIILSM